MNKFDILRKYFGYEKFRRGQEEIIDALIDGRDVLCVMPTGGGKSICYQVPALLSDGVTIVISPLISLMTDQVNSLNQNGISSAFINSTMSNEEYNSTLKELRMSKYKLIYVAPERLLNNNFIEICKQIKISYIAIDEAHCISQWGQDFRPSYLKINEFIDRLSTRPILGAFTATATNDIKEDIIERLRLNNPLKLTTGFDRPNLSFTVIKPDDKLKTLEEILKNYEDRTGIVYCSTRKSVEEICDYLCDLGYNATRYHAGLSDDERKINQEDFMFDRKKIIVATNAFGMGIDKSNVSFVIHFNMPKNIESYYQEAGRAGRDGEKANCILLYKPSDIRLNNFLIESSQNNPQLDQETIEMIRERDRQRLKQMTFYCTTSDCLRSFILKYFGEKSEEYCGNCSNCLNGYELVDVTIPAQKIMSCIVRTESRYGMKMISDILLGKKSQRILELNLDRQTTYGLLSNMSDKEVRSIINHLILKGFLNTTTSQYPTLQLTELSKSVLSGKTKIEMKIHKNEIVHKQQSDNEIDDLLLKQLKELRNNLAKAEHVPAYIIFSDSSLLDMANKMPESHDDFLKVSGVGYRKLEKYGEQFINVIKSFNTGDEKITEEKQVGSFDQYKQSLLNKGFVEAYAPWTTEEDNQLIEEYNSNMLISEISIIHKRTYGAIRSRMKKLNLYLNEEVCEK